MIPLHDDNPTRSFPFITIFLIVANVAVFLYQLSLPRAAIEPFFADFAVIPAHVTGAGTPHAYATMVTSMFLHGGLLHLLGNMLYLWIFGNNIEDACGHFRFVLFYLLTGVGAAAAQIAVTPDSQIPMVGASGAISGILGAYLLLYPRARVLVLVPLFIFVKFFYVPAALLLVFWFALQLLSGWATVGESGGGVAFWAHIGGFVAGLVLIPIFKRRSVHFFR